MLGLIFFELKKFIYEKYGLESWERIKKRANIKEIHFESVKAYPDHDIFNILKASSDLLKVSIPQFEEEFGIFLGPVLLRTTYKIDPQWGLMDLLLHTQNVIHESIHQALKESTTPFLDIKKIADNQLLITYTSKRKMCYLAKGLIKGLSKHYKTPVKINELKCMHKGDASCLLEVTVGVI